MTPPYNFSWIVKDKLAGMAQPKSYSDLEFLVQHGIGHLVTLSPEKPPPTDTFHGLNFTLIPVEEFEPPTIEDIVQFIDICRMCHEQNQAVAVHCRMGVGRTGVMAACYLVYFEDLSPSRAISKLRKLRPWSVETPEQERVVSHYRDYLRTLDSS